MVGEVKCSPNPHRLQKFIDSGGPSVSHRPPPTASTYSWDGLSVDPRPFARLERGARVIEPEERPDGGILGGAAVEPFLQTIRRVGGDEAENERKDMNWIAESQFYDSKRVQSPGLVRVPVPEVIEKAGPQAACLLTPKERRILNDYETKAHRAEKIRRAEQQNMQRLVRLMETQYAHGVLHPANAPFLGTNASARSSKQTDMGMTARQARLHHLIGDPVNRHGFNPLASSYTVVGKSAVDPGAKFMQEKKRVHAYADAHPTCSLTMAELHSVKPERTRHLVAMDQRGRQSNIVTHAALPPHLQVSF